MDDDLQQMVDSLALSIRRSVAVDDAQLRLLRSSSHFGDEDDLRLKSLVDRRVPNDVASLLHRQGVPSWRSPGHVAGTAEVPFSTRWCVPLRTRYELLGFLWVIDDHTLTPTELDLIAEGAERFETYLGREAERRAGADRRREESVRGILRGTETERARAESALDDVPGLQRAPFVSVVVVDLGHGVPEAEISAQAFLSRGVRAGLATRPPGSYAIAVDDSEAIALVGWAAEPTIDDAGVVASRITDGLERTDQALAGVTVTGVGGLQGALSAAHVAYRQAKLAVRVARARERRFQLWEGIGPDALVASVATSRPDPSVLPEPFATQLAQQGDETLELVAAYLDNGGSAALTATQLNLHRSTLYYRVARFEQATGLSLDRGADRLAVHLWLALRPY